MLVQAGEGMGVITVRVPEELKREIELFPDVNWSEVVREAVRARVRVEMAKRGVKDKGRILEAFKVQDEIAAKTLRYKGEWSGVEVIRWWREHRYSSSTPRSQ